MQTARFALGVLFFLNAASVFAKPLATVNGFSGKFQWVKLPDLPTATLKSLAHAKAVSIVVSFPTSVHLKSAKGGYPWFTLILADQGSDYKWHQTTGSGAVPATGGTIKAGTYSILVPLKGIPASVLGEKKQTISLGPASSGNASISFSVIKISGS